MNLLVVITVLALSVLAFIQDTSAERFVFVVPGSFSAEDKKQILESTDRFSEDADPGDLFSFYDGSSGRRIAAGSIPTTRSKSARISRMRKIIAPFVQFLEQSKSVRSGEGATLDIPLVFDTVASTLRGDGDGTTLIIFGSLYRPDADDPGCRYSPGEVPNHAHLFSEESEYSTVGREESLAGVTVHWVTLGELGKTKERRAAEEFIGLLIGGLGGVFSTSQPSASLVMDRALSGVNDPLVRVEPDKSDTTLRILKIGETPLSPVVLPVPKPRPVTETVPEPVVESDAQMPSFDVVMVFDRSDSNAAGLAEGCRLVKSVAVQSSTRSSRFRIGVVFHGGGKPSIRSVPLTEIGQGPGDPGQARLNRAITEPVQKVLVVSQSVGETGSAPTGESRMIGLNETVLGYADLEGAIKEATQILNASDADVRILFIAGDVGCTESDNIPSDNSTADRRSAERTISMVRGFARESDGAHVVTLFTGDEHDPHRDTTLDLFRRFASFANSRGLSTEHAAEAEAEILRLIGG